MIVEMKMIRKLLCLLGWHEWIWRKKSWAIQMETLGIETQIDPIAAWEVTCKHCGKIRR